jgi:hypothetical protein
LRLILRTFIAVHCLGSHDLSLTARLAYFELPLVALGTPGFDRVTVNGACYSFGLHTVGPAYAPSIYSKFAMMQVTLARVTIATR